ncbi:MAG: hypothetical protein JKX87_07005 [Cycloclasticus sp.]|nr:hypothetical protein [Cycloclasticus sp.]
MLHELHLAMRYCDSLVLLNKGQVASEGTPENVLTPEYMSTIYGVDAIYGEHLGCSWILPWSNKKGEEH